MISNPYLTVLICLEENTGALQVLQKLLFVLKMFCIICGINHLIFYTPQRQAFEDFFDGL